MFKIRKRVLSAVMSMALLSTMVLQPLSDNNAKAASSSVKYIKTVKVFTKENGTLEDAKAWCSAQDENKDSDENNNWNVIDGNLNDGAEASVNGAVGVFLVYQTTTDAKEAVTDLAVMNERGNYSSAEYQRILTEQKEVYKDIVSDMKDMLAEYRTNYKNGRKSAITVHDFLNAYIEDDSGKLLGDLLLDITDDDLVELLLQANGQVLLTIQDQLAYACENQNNTWLDRMEKLGSYDKMVKSLTKTKKLKTSDVKDYLKRKYNDRALKLLESWEDVYMHFEFVQQYEANHGKADMTDAEWIETIENRINESGKSTKSDGASTENTTEDDDLYSYIHEVTFLKSLNNYFYDGKTLMAYFAQTYDEVSGDNITKLYPLAAALTEGQMGALNESVSLYTLIESAIFASAYNGYKTGKIAEYGENIDDENKKNMDECLKKSEEMISDLKNTDSISVYEGVDREIFDGGVAVTSSAKAYSDIVPENWTDSFVHSGVFSKTAIGMAVGALCFSVASIACAVSLNSTLSEIATLSKGNPTSKVLEKTYNSIRNNFLDSPLYSQVSVGGPDELSFYAAEYTYKEFKQLKVDLNTYEAAYSKDTTMFTREDIRKASIELKNKSKANAIEEGKVLSEKNATKIKVLRGLKIGFAVVAILLAVADIVMTTITFYKYYKRDHVDVPKFMVDVSYEEDKASSFINYKNVLSTDGTAGDLNGGGGKQWLALYSTYDRSAGNPILAPDGDNNKFIYSTGKEVSKNDYSPLHMFGTVNTAQNLTYADGESGYSFNDKNKGTYLYFKRDANPYYGDVDNNPKTATTISKGFIALGGGVGLVLGFIIALIVFRVPKKKEENMA